MLTRKYYRMIANSIKYASIYANNNTRQILNKDKLINDLGEKFKQDNSLFCWDKFEDACK